MGGPKKTEEAALNSSHKGSKLRQYDEEDFAKACRQLVI